MEPDFHAAALETLSQSEPQTPQMPDFHAAALQTLSEQEPAPQGSSPAPQQQPRQPGNVPPPPPPPTPGLVPEQAPSGNIGAAFNAANMPPPPSPVVAANPLAAAQAQQQAPQQLKQAPSNPFDLHAIYNEIKPVYEAARKAPMIGPTVGNVGEAVKNAVGVAPEMQAAFNKGATGVLDEVGSLGTGALQGAAQGAEALGGLAEGLYGISPNGLAEEAMRRAGLPIRKTQLIPRVNGQLPSQILGDAGQQAFPHQQHSQKSAALAGSLIPAAPAIPVEQQLVKQLSKIPGLRKITDLIAGALTGAGYGTAYQAGTNVANNKPVTENLGDSALTGGTIGGILGHTARGGRLKQEQAAKNQAAQAAVDESRRFFKQTGKDMLQFRANQMGAKEPPPEAHQGPSEEEARDFWKQKLNARGEQAAKNQAAQAAVDESQNVAKTPTEPTNTHEQRMEVHPDDVREQNPETRRYTEPFNPEGSSRKVLWKGTGKIHAGKPHPTKPGMVRIGGIIDGKGVQREQEAISALDRGTNMADQLENAPAGLTDEQQHAHDRGVEEMLAGHTREEQAEVIQKIAAAQKAIEAVDSGNADSIPSQGPRDMPVLHGGIGVQALVDMAKEVPGVGQQLSHELQQEAHGAKKFLQWLKGFALADDTHDSVAAGAQRNKSDFIQRFNGELRATAVDMLGADVTSGETGAKVRAWLKDPESGLKGLSPEQQFKAEKLKTRLGNLKNLANEEAKTFKDDKEYTKALQELTGQRRGSSGGGVDNVWNTVNNYLLTSRLTRNPAFHTLLLTHPIQMSAIAGPINTAQALFKTMHDPVAKGWLDKTHNLTTDWRDTLKGDIQQGEGKPPSEDWQTSRHNNKVFLLAGMIEKAKELHGANWQDELNRIMENPTSYPSSSQTKILEHGIDTMREATGNLPFTSNKPFTSRNLVTRTVAELSGYKGLVDRLMIRSLKDMATPGKRAAGLKRLGLLYGATIAGGGSAGVPTEVRDMLWRRNPTGMYYLEKMMDDLNVPAKLSSRTLTEHMRLGLLNWGYSVPMSAVQTYQRLAESGNKKEAMDMLGEMVASSPFLGFNSTLLGVGRGVLQKNILNMQKATQGEKSVQAYLGPHRIGKKGTEDYTPLSPLADLLAGQNVEEYNYKHKQYVQYMFNKAGFQAPKSLEQDYPSPHIRFAGTQKKLTDIKKTEA